jgi:DNA-binding NarL/FixJ family response regulator
VSSVAQEEGVNLRRVHAAFIEPRTRHQEAIVRADWFGVFPRLGEGRGDTSAFGHVVIGAGFCAMRSGKVRHVFLIEDHPLFRAALRDLLLREHPACIVDEAPDWRTARARLAGFGQGAARLIISDVRLPDTTGPDWLLELRDLMRPDDVLFVLTADDDAASRAAACAAGAKQLFPKTLEVPLLLERFAELLDVTAAREPPLSSVIEGIALSPRQLAVAWQLQRGFANKEIARRLNVGTETVKSHVSEIIARLGVRNRTEAVLELARHGLREQPQQPQQLPQPFQDPARLSTRTPIWSQEQEEGRGHGKR